MDFNTVLANTTVKGNILNDKSNGKTYNYILDDQDLNALAKGTLTKLDIIDSKFQHQE